MKSRQHGRRTKSLLEARTRPYPGARLKYGNELTAVEGAEHLRSIIDRPGDTQDVSCINIEHRQIVYWAYRPGDACSQRCRCTNRQPFDLAITAPDAVGDSQLQRLAVVVGGVTARLGRDQGFERLQAAPAASPPFVPTRGCDR
jgi:hypothetical protein